MLVQATQVRDELMPLPRVENSNMAPIGVRKKRPKTIRAITRNTWVRMRLRRLISATSLEPARGSALQDGVRNHHDRHDHDHSQSQRLRLAGIGQADLALDQIANRQGHDRIALVDQRRGGRVRRKRVGEEQEGGAQESREEQWPGDVAPVVPAVAAKALRRLAPLRADAVERGQKDQDHQGNLEVQVDQYKAGELVQPDAVRVDVDAVVLQVNGNEARATDGRDEGEGKRHATELGEHAGHRSDHASEQPLRVSEHDRIGEDRTSDGAYDGAHEREKKTVQVRTHNVALRQGGLDLGECRIAILVEEGTGHDDGSREEQEEADIRKERYDADPGQRKTPAAPDGATGGHYSRPVGCRQEMAAAQWAARYAPAAVACASLRKTGVPLTGGSAAAAAASMVPADCIACIRTGRANPFSQRFCPSSE